MRRPSSSSTSTNTSSITSGKSLISDSTKCILLQFRQGASGTGSGSRSPCSVSVNGSSAGIVASRLGRLGYDNRTFKEIGAGAGSHHSNNGNIINYTSTSNSNGINSHPAVRMNHRKYNGTGQKESAVHQHHHWNEIDSTAAALARTTTTAASATVATESFEKRRKGAVAIFTKRNELNAAGEWKIYCLISMSVLMCYANGLFGAFVHDDIPAIVMNNDVNGINPLKKLIQNDFWGTPMSDSASHKSYRPLTTITFRLNCFLLGMRPMWFHTVNIMLHLLATALFTKFCLLILKMKKEFAIIAGLLFAVHPIHTEAVTGIVGRADILAGIFFMLSMMAHSSEKSPKILLSILFGGLSMLAKETGLTVLVVNLVFDILRRWELIRRLLYEKQMGTECKILIQRTILLTFVTLILLSARLGIFKDPFPKFSEQDNPAAFSSHMLTRFCTYSYLFVYNIWLMLCPADLSHDWQMGSIPLVSSFMDKRNLITLTTFLILLVIGYTSVFNSEKLTMAIGYLVMGLPLLPACNIISTVGFVLAERVLYIPSFGFIILVVHGLQIAWESVNRARPFLATMIILLIVSYACKTINRNIDWQTRESLLRSGLKVLPHNAKMHYNYGNFLKDTQHWDSAVLHYREAIRLWPSYASAHNNLGTLMPTVEHAEHHFKEAIRYYDSHVNAHCNLGLLYRSSNRTALAEIMLRKCVSLRPNSRLPYLVLAKIDRGMSKGHHLKSLASVKPESTENKSIYGKWLLENNFLYEAEQELLRALQITPNHFKSYLEMCKLFRKFGQKSRLLQLILRRHIIQRSRKGELMDRNAIYLHTWSIRHEIRNRAMLYDMIIASNVGTSVQQKSPVSSDINKQHQSSTQYITRTSKNEHSSSCSSATTLRKSMKSYPDTRKVNQTSTAVGHTKDHILHSFLRNILYKV